MAGIENEYPRIMNLAEAARFIRVSEKTMGEMARQGRLPCNRVGREWRFLRAGLEEWLKGEGRGDSSADEEQKPVQPGPSQARLFGEAGFRDTAFSQNRTEPVHRWVPWIAGFSSSFVQGVFESLLSGAKGKRTILDPFAGVGTTLVEGLKRDYGVVGFEINPYAYLACKVKLGSQNYSPELLKERIRVFGNYMSEKLSGGKAPASLPPPDFKSRIAFFSPKVERKVLLALDFISRQEAWVKDIFRLALGAVMVSFSNYSYEPSLGRRSTSGKSDILDADVAGIIAGKLEEFVQDIIYLRSVVKTDNGNPSFSLFNKSYFEMNGELRPRSIDLLVTSPPYLNNYHYVRNTRPQLYWLGLATESLKSLEEFSFGKYWQTVRSRPRVEADFDLRELKSLIGKIRQINPEKGPYGGPGWANYATTYFNDCLKFLKVTSRIMKKGAPVVVVIGNNILQGIELKTDLFFAQLGEQLGYRIIDLHQVRTKRTGSSIINSSVRIGSQNQRVKLYETAVELRAP